MVWALGSLNQISIDFCWYSNGEFDGLGSFTAQPDVFWFLLIFQYRIQWFDPLARSTRFPLISVDISISRIQWSGASARSTRFLLISIDISIENSIVWALGPLKRILFETLFIFQLGIQWFGPLARLTRCPFISVNISVEHSMVWALGPLNHISFDFWWYFKREFNGLCTRPVQPGFLWFLLIF